MALSRSTIRGRAGIGGFVAALLSVSACESDSNFAPRLAALTVVGGSDVLYPNFKPDVFNYAVTCRGMDKLTVSARAGSPREFVSIDGATARLSTSQSEISNPDQDQDIQIEVIRGGLSKRYTVHCIPEDLPQIDVLHAEEGVSPNLLYLTPQYFVAGARTTFLVIADNNGVPRFTRKIDGRAFDFKRHSNGKYSYALLIGQNQFGISDAAIVVLDEEFREIGRYTTVGLNQTDHHDVILLESGGLVLLSYNSTVRDMTAYGLSSQEIVGDSVIQELDADGSVVLEWNSWDHIDLADCQATGFRRFPTDYAHVNSVKLTPDGDLIASFRGCSQVIKIDRPTGEVIWYLGGTNSDYEIIGDPFGEFCGQHTVSQIGADRVLLFDNGSLCLGDREGLFGQFSRAVEYRLDDAAGQANFVRDYSRNSSYQEFTRSQGSVQLLSNGNWLIGWGNGPEIAVTEVGPLGESLFELSLSVDGAVAVSYRAFRAEN